MPILTLPHENQVVHTVRAKALVFEDPRSQELLRRIQQVAPSSATVLITGETGTGKEIVARHIHELSLRAKSTFAAVNCAAFSETLVESELFGHERGAFTGADRAKAGWFEAAHGGTLFLDEVGDLPMSIQVKLLRVLQESEVVRIGSRQPLAINVRLVAATNVDLEQAIDAGHFREDLFYRLNVTTLRLLPLRERPGDLLPLSSYFAELYARRLGKPAMSISPSALERLLEHVWPGNIRELENVIHHATLVCRTDVIEADHLHITPTRRKTPSVIPAAIEPSTPSAHRTTSDEEGLANALRVMFEREHPDLYERIEDLVFRTAYAYCDNNQLQTARLLGISRNIVRGRLAQHGHLPPLRRAVPRASGTSLEPVRTRVRVGFQRFGILLLVKAQGRLEADLAQRGISIEWLEYPAGPELLAALEDDRLDIGVVGELPPVSAQAAQVPFVYVAAEAPAPDAEAIIVHQDSQIRSIGDLRGKRVVLSAGANVHYLLIRALEEANLDYTALELTFCAPEKAQRAFLQREVDAWGIWDPLLASVQQSTPTRVLRDAFGLTSNAAYYVARREFADAQPNIVHTLMEHVTLAGYQAQQSPDSAARELAVELDLPSEGLALALRRYRGTGPVTPELLDSQQRIANKLHDLRMIPRAISVADACWRPRAHAERAVLP